MYRGSPSPSEARRKRVVLRSTSPFGGAEAGRLCSLAVVLLLSLSSFAIISSSSASSAGADLETSALQSDAYEFPASDRLWDWAALADEAGFVDVIVSMPSSVLDRSPIEKAYVEASDAAAGRGDDDGLLKSVASPKAFGSSLNGFSARLDLDTIESLLLSEPGLSIYPDIILNATDTDDVRRIGADKVWVMTDPEGLYVTGLGIVVAVIDTGIDYTHPDLGGGFGPSYKVIGGYDFVNDDTDPMDDNGHGTHVAGIIAADGVIMGVAPDAELLAYKALNAGGAGSMSDVILAIDAALDPNGDGLTNDHADIISMSLGGAGSTDDPVCQAVEAAIAEGVVVVVASGNAGPSLGTVATPGLAPSALTVGAVDNDGVLAGFSSRGPTPEMGIKPEISAPGVDILSTVPYSGTVISSPTGYASLSGTSMATPHVSGAVALLLQMHPSWTPTMVKSAVVSNPTILNESLWAAGAGEIWIPGAAEETLFSSTPMLSYGLAGSSSQSMTVTNTGTTATYSVSSSDFYSLTANGSFPEAVHTDMSSASPSSVYLISGSSGPVTLTVATPPVSSDEGYYAGNLLLESSSGTLSIPFGFVILSTLNVHVYDASGAEVFDPYGGVWVYDIPDASFAMGLRGEMNPVPPATFFLPSGTYAVHALGHQLLYTYSDPYVLSSTVTVGMLETVDVDIYMADAHKMTLDLETEDGQPIYVKDYRVYCRYEGARNISFDLTGSDYSIVGAEVFSIPHSMDVYVSDTSAEIGISIAGFAYTPAMWSFMNLNWQHWYEYISGSSTAFMVEASADLQYLLAWEFDGVDFSAPSVLTWDESSAAVFETEYDIPGTITDPWCNWGSHRAMGGDATFYVRRDTDTSLNPFFSGMTRKTVVTGTFSELYFPRSVVGGYVERQFFVADYDHLLESTAAGVFLPDRNYLEPLEPSSDEQRLGSGPFYPSLFTESTDGSLVLYHPLLRDQSGARVGGSYIPSMSLYRDGGLIGIYQLSEYLARPDAKRVVDLFGSGTYVATINYMPTSQVTSSVAMELGFTVPSVDRDPPRVTGLEMSQRFVPGASVPVSLDVVDSMSSITVELRWRAGPADTWKSLTVSSSGSTYSVSIPTTEATASIDLEVTVTDSYSNYMSAVLTSASLAQIPVVFELAPESPTVEYRDATVSVVLEGQLTDMSGNPLSATAGVPIELFSGDQKVAMVLDEYVLGTTHTHNGDIRFQWMLNPTTLFTGTGQDVQVTATFDLGVYESISVSFTLTSVPSDAVAPVIELVSPADGSLMASGAVVDLDVTDDGAVDVLYSLDGGAFVTLAEPWDISTSSWSDGVHALGVTVMDDDGFTVTASYSFDVDAEAPELEIVQPALASQVPLGFEMIISVSDRHLSGVSYSLDSSASVPILYPYTVDMAGWSVGMHVVAVEAADEVGHESSESVYFEIVNSTIVAMLSNPEDGSYIVSGTPLQLLVYSTGTATCSWSNGGSWTVLSSPYAIPTDGWAEGAYDVSVQATDDLGGSVAFSFTVTVDDTVPEIVLMWPLAGAYVTPDDIVSFQVTDDYLDYAVWSVLGISETTTSGTFTVSLSSVELDGSFSLTVHAYDLAGNSAEDAIAFTMDLYDPLIGIAGVASGDSVLLGEGLLIEASDSHLMDMSLSFDGGGAVAGYPGMTISTDALALGWHELVLTASDLSGRITVTELSIYVDGTPPEVQLTGPVEFVADEPLTLTTAASDDFAVAGGLAYYELEDGGYGSVAMSVSGSELVAAIQSALLWDGMEIYVLAQDEAGNSAESDHVVAVEVSSLSDGSGGAWYSSAIGLASIGAAAVVIAIAVLMLSRRRSGTVSDHPAERPRRPVYSVPEARVVSAPAQVVRVVPAEAQRKAASPSATGRVRSDSYARQAILDQVPSMSSSAGVAGAVVIGRTVMEPAPQPREEDDVDYGELIERELIQGVFKRSAYQDMAKDTHVWSTVAPVPPEERIISALRLKRLMDGEALDDDTLF